MMSATKGEHPWGCAITMGTHPDDPAIKAAIEQMAWEGGAPLPSDADGKPGNGTNKAAAIGRYVQAAMAVQREAVPMGDAFGPDGHDVVGFRQAAIQAGATEQELEDALRNARR